MATPTLRISGPSHHLAQNLHAPQMGRSPWVPGFLLRGLLQIDKVVEEASEVARYRYI